MTFSPIEWTVFVFVVIATGFGVPAMLDTVEHYLGTPVAVALAGVLLVSSVALLLGL